MNNEQEIPAINMPEGEVQQTTLLFVDDESNILTSLRRLFRGSGYKVLIAESGTEGLSLLEQENVDLVVSDMRMPEMDGAQFLEQVALKWPETIRILLTGYADMQSTIDAINKGNIYKYISKPWEDHELKLSVKHALEQKRLREERDGLLIVTERQNEELKDLNANLEQKVAQRTEELSKANELLKNNHVSSIKTFASIIEAREGVNAGHARRVAEKAKNIAGDMGLSPKECQDILFAGLLHDMGKIGLSDRVLHKPVNEMSTDEREEYKKHPIMGEALLTSLESFQDVAKLIRHHHERHNGSGYPDGLRFDEIPRGAMILSMLSDYDDLLNGSLDGLIYSQAGALQYIKDHIGSRYNPVIVDAFTKCLTLDMATFKGSGKRKGESESEAKGSAKSVEFGSNQLVSGMVLAKDLYVGENILLLSEGHILNQSFIDKIKSFETSMMRKFRITVWRGIRK